MEIEKTKVKGLDVLLQVMIAIFSLGWMGLYSPFLLETKFGLRYYGSEVLTVFLAGITFSVIVFVFVTFLFRKITATVVRVLFTFSFVLLMYQFNSFFCSIWEMLFESYYRPSGEDLIAILVISLAPMVLILLMLCFAMTRQKYSGMFIGQVICLILLVISDVFTGVYVFDEYDMELEVLCYYSAMWMFQLMLALLSIWLRRRNYYRVKEECETFGCPFAKGSFVPTMAVPLAMSAPVVPTVPEEPKPVAPVVSEEPKPVVFENDTTPTLEPVWKEPATQIDVPEEEPATQIAGFEEVAPTEEPAPIEEPALTQEPATSILAEPVQGNAPVAPISPEPKARYCSNCGTLLEEGTFFCCECGTKIEG